MLVCPTRGTPRSLIIPERREAQFLQGSHLSEFTSLVDVDHVKDSDNDNSLLPFELHYQLGVVGAHRIESIDLTQVPRVPISEIDRVGSKRKRKRERETEAHGEKKKEANTVQALPNFTTDFQLSD